jgi:excisionase family DNA binding protein
METTQGNVTGRRSSRSEQAPVQRLAYPVAGAAQRIGVSRSSAYELIAEGKLKSIWVAGRRLVTEDAIRELLENSEQPLTESPRAHRLTHPAPSNSGRAA